MKKLFLILIFLSLTISGYSQGFNSVHSADGNYVMAVGDDGLVFRSANGGANWESYSLSAFDFKGVFIVGTTFHIATESGIVFRGSTASPNVLTPSFLGDGVELNDVFFLNSNDGFVCGDGGKVYKTNDGGTTWSLISTGIAAVNLNAISFSDANNGVVVGNNGAIYITNNGGTSWTSETSGTSYDLLAVKYFSGGITAVGKYGTLLMKTGAGSFTAVDSKIITDINGVSGPDFNNVHLCGGGGFIRNNKSGSSEFLNFEMNPMTADLSGIYFTDANTGYAVSSLNKAVIKTTDGGNSWSLTGGTTITHQWQTKLTGSGGIGNGFYYAPPAYQSPERRDVVYICQGNVIHRSYDRGETWQQIATVSIGSRAHSFYVSPIDSNLMIASMDSFDGKVVRSTNHGATWTLVWSGALTSYGMPLEMDPSNPNNLVLGPDNSTLLKSTNFGLNWTTLSPTVFVSPCDITIHPENPDLMLLGDSGPSKLWKSSNGGLNWTLTNSQSTSEVPMIGITQLDINLAFHTVWSTGGVFKTTNAGSNFSNVTTTGSAWGCDIAKDDPTGFAFVTYGRVGYVTTNAGATFTNVGSIGSANAGVLYLNKGQILAQGTGGVYKLGITYNVNATPVVVTAVELINSSLPDRYALGQNYPNPFNPSTKIQYQLPEAGNVKITVFDVKGAEVDILFSGVQNAGTYNIDFDGSRLTSGVYFYKLETEAFTDVKKMMLVK